MILPHKHTGTIKRSRCVWTYTWLVCRFVCVRRVECVFCWASADRAIVCEQYNNNEKEATAAVVLLLTITLTTVMMLKLCVDDLSRAARL